MTTIPICKITYQGEEICFPTPDDAHRYLSELASSHDAELQFNKNINQFSLRFHNYTVLISLITVPLILYKS